MSSNTPTRLYLLKYTTVTFAVFPSCRNTCSALSDPDLAIVTFFPDAAMEAAASNFVWKIKGSASRSWKKPFNSESLLPAQLLFPAYLEAPRHVVTVRGSRRLHGR